MPFGDGTGPNSAGPMTGRGRGFCAGYFTPGNTKPFSVRRGRRNRRLWCGAAIIPAGVLAARRIARRSKRK